MPGSWVFTCSLNSGLTVSYLLMIHIPIFMWLSNYLWYLIIEKNTIHFIQFTHFVYSFPVLWFIQVVIEYILLILSKKIALLENSYKSKSSNMEKFNLLQSKFILKSPQNLMLCQGLYCWLSTLTTLILAIRALIILLVLFSSLIM